MRPVLRWFGGKYRLASWVVSHMPEHRVYTEVFGGAGSVLMKKPRSYAEVYNDLDDSVWNLFHVLQNPPWADRLEWMLRNTPFSRREFELAHVPHPDPVENARRLVIRSFMGFGADSASQIESRTSFRANSNRSRTTPAHDWLTYPNSVQAFAQRLAGVVVEHRHAIDVLVQHDGPDTLHYVDPPYPLSTRGGRHRYSHEMSDQDHVELREVLLVLKGKVMVSGYAHPIYDGMGWRRVEKEARADGGKATTEVIWMNW